MVDDVDGCEPAFFVQGAAQANAFHVLFDRGGLVLTRSVAGDEFLDHTARAIRSLVQPEGAIRGLRVRSVLLPDGGVAFGPALHVAGIAGAQRSIERGGARLLPDLRLWLDADGRDVRSGEMPTRFVFQDARENPAPTSMRSAAMLGGTLIDTPTSERQSALEWALATVEAGLGVRTVRAQGQSALVSALIGN